MTDKPNDGKCQCPILRLASEIERMAGCGIIPQDNDYALSGRLKAIGIAVSRDKYGCNGPARVSGVCPFEFSHFDMTTDPNVPLLKRRVEDKQDGHYL